MSLLAVVAAVMLVLTNGVFVAVEFAMVASQRAKLELLAGTGSKRADIALDTIRDLPRQLAGSQLGITVCSLGLGVLGEPAVADVIGPILDKIGLLSHNVSHGIAFALSLALVVTAHMVLGEMVPKGIALAGPERTLLVLAPVSRTFTGFFPFSPLFLFSASDCCGHSESNDAQVTQAPDYSQEVTEDAEGDRSERALSLRSLRPPVRAA